MGKRRRPYRTHFVSDGIPVALHKPRGRPSADQLEYLNRLGGLEIAPQRVKPLTKGEVAAAIDEALKRNAAVREKRAAAEARLTQATSKGRPRAKPKTTGEAERREAAARAELDRDPEGWGE